MEKIIIELLKGIQLLIVSALRELQSVETVKVAKVAKVAKTSKPKDDKPIDIKGVKLFNVSFKDTVSKKHLVNIVNMLEFHTSKDLDAMIEDFDTILVKGMTTKSNKTITLCDDLQGFKKSELKKTFKDLLYTIE